ncbi:MAG: hypothetical protein JSS61_02100 [Verrucomicrobia bacterium]|nr:hypothetical protein [Verrucomicrobiota bacterium]
MKEIGKRLVFCLPLIHSIIAYSADIDDSLLVAETYLSKAEVEGQTYTINFNNIAMTEFVRFASKITGFNFVFEEADLRFAVTIVSEEPVSAKNVLSALAQVLRMHDLTLVEQGGSILITKSTRVHTIPPIISADMPGSEEKNAALVTRVFRIKNANLNSVASIIRPMTSDGALIEVSNETRQLIVTDVITNVEQVASLLASLDAPHTPLDVDSYIVKNIAPQELIALTQQLLTPFTEGNPLIFVPQIETNTIYMVSTPYLIERAMTVMEDLDIPPKPIVTPHFAGTKGIFIYKALSRPPEALIGELKQVSEQLRTVGGTHTALESAINTVKIIRGTGSLMFVADDATSTKIQEILATLDAPSLTQSTFYMYRIAHAHPDQLQNALRKVAHKAKDVPQPDFALIDAIGTMNWIEDTNSLTFTGDTDTLEKLKMILESLDVPTSLEAQSIASGPTTFYLYKLQGMRGDKVIEELKLLATKLPKESPNSGLLVSAIDKIEWVKANNALLLTGTPAVIEQVKQLISEFDSAGEFPYGASARAFLIYKGQYVPSTDLKMVLHNLTVDLQEGQLQDPELFQALESMRYVESTDSLLFTGTQQALDQIQMLINSIDNAGATGPIQHVGNVTFLLYKVQAAAPDKLVSAMRSFASDLKKSNVEDQSLADAIASARWIRETNSLLFTGSAIALERLDELLKKFDVPSLAGNPPPTAREASTFVIYNPKHQTGDELISTLCDFMYNLKSSGVSDPGLFDAIDSLRYMEQTDSLIISGEPAPVEKVQDLLTKFDVPTKEGIEGAIESINDTSFLVYKLQFHTGSDIQEALKQVATNLATGANPPAELVEAINSLQWVQVTNSLLGSGQPDVLMKLRELIQNLDTPLRQVFIEVLVITTSLGNTQNFGLMWGTELQYMNKTLLTGGNFPTTLNSANSSSSTIGQTFSNSLGTINATTTPKGGAGLIPFTTGFDLGVIGDIIMHKGRSFLSLGSLVNALQLDTDTTIVLNPKIVAQDNRESSIFVGTNVPYTGAIVTTQSNSTTTTSNIEYRDVGVSLTITPILGDNDVVTLDIINDISQVTNGASSTSTQVLTGITTSRTHMETRVHVPNDHFVALSGMIQDTKSHFRTAIPCLGGLPVIGALFSENDRSNTKANVIIFVRPHIINSHEDMKRLTEHQEWLFKDSARLPVLKEEFDEGIDMVKTPENE